MGKKRDVFKILDNYMTSDAMAQEVKGYIEAVVNENERLKKKSFSKTKGE